MSDYRIVIRPYRSYTPPTTAPSEGVPKVASKQPKAPKKPRKSFSLSSKMRKLKKRSQDSLSSLIRKQNNHLRERPGEESARCPHGDARIQVTQCEDNVDGKTSQ